MGLRPPLELNDSELDGVTAISVWSHHRADATEIWADEVARILKPGGWFAVTFCGPQHIRWMAARPNATEKSIQTMSQAVEETGNHFVPVNYLGEARDTDVDWGQSTFSTDRFFAIFERKFNLAGYFPGINQGNQDLAVFCKK